MRKKLKYPNFPFWCVILMLMGLVWFYLTGVNNDIQLYMASDLPNEIIEGNNTRITVPSLETNDFS